MYRLLIREFSVHKLSFAVPIIALALASCDPVSERQCGVFDHPDLALWRAETGESQVQFMSEDGTSIDFNRQTAVLNEPYLNSDGSSNDEDVVCELSARIRLQATDGSLAITSTYIQLEQLLLPSADEVLLIDHTIEAPVGTQLPGSFPAEITDVETRIIFDPDRVEYLDPEVTSAEIGGQSYEDVIRINAIGFPLEADTDIDASAPASSEADTDTATDTDSETGTGTETDIGTGTSDTQAESADPVRQIVIAREFGIVAFTDNQGREFVRVP